MHRSLPSAAVLGLAAALATQAASFTELTGTALGGGSFRYDLHIQYGGLVTGIYDVGFGGNFTNRISYAVDPSGWTNNPADPNVASWNHTTHTLPQQTFSSFTVTSSESGSRTGRMYILFGLTFWYCRLGVPTLMSPVGYTAHYAPVPCTPAEHDGATTIQSTVTLADDPEISGVSSNTITFVWPTESTVSIQGSTNLTDWTHLAYALGYSNTTTWTSSFPLIASGSYFRAELVYLCHDTNLAQRGAADAIPAQVLGVRPHGGGFAVDFATEAEKPYAVSLRRTDGSVAHAGGTFTATGGVTTVAFPALDAKDPLFFDARRL